MLERRRGFTLIELMVVVAIIGILASVAIPKFAELMRKSGEGSSKANLGSLRATLSIYYGDMDGQYPASLPALTISGKYVSSVPQAKAPNYHPDTSVSRALTGACAAVNWDIDEFASGGWTYCAAPHDPALGGVVVNCSHTDTKGAAWSSY